MLWHLFLQFLSFSRVLETTEGICTYLYCKLFVPYNHKLRFKILQTWYREPHILKEAQCFGTL